MRVLIACEESQTVCKEFRLLGHEAFSCDIKATSGTNPEWHIIGDAIKIAYENPWDLMIAHPPCTYLAVSGARHLYNRDGTKNEDRWRSRNAALQFVQKLMDAPIDRIAIENPVSCISTEIRKPDQIVQPYHFGDSYQKTTCLWLKNLPLLKPTNIVDRGDIVTFSNGKKCSQWYFESRKGTAEQRRTARSKTFVGFAKAMASQWTNISDPVFHQLQLF